MKDVRQALVDVLNGLEVGRRRRVSGKTRYLDGYSDLSVWTEVEGVQLRPTGETFGVSCLMVVSVIFALATKAGSAVHDATDMLVDPDAMLGRGGLDPAVAIRGDDSTSVVWQLESLSEGRPNHDPDGRIVEVRVVGSLPLRDDTRGNAGFVLFQFQTEIAVASR